MKNSTLKRLSLSLALTFVCSAASLFAVDLAQLMALAQEKSPQMQSYLLTRQNSEIANALTDTDDDISVEVSSGNATVKYVQPTTIGGISTQGYTATSIEPSVSVTLPNDGKTTIKASSGASVNFYENGARSYDLSPTVEASHTFTFGETGDSRSDLLYSQNLLLASQTYASNVLNFENQVYQKVSSILSIEKQMNEARKSIDDLRISMDNALKLGSTNKDAVAYKNQELQLLSLENTLKTLELSHDYALEQFKILTGLDYDGDVTGIREASPEFSPLANGNTAVLLKQMSLQIAQEDLKLERARTTNTTLNVAGGLGVPVTRTGGTNSYSVASSAGALLAGSNYSVSASANLKYSITDDELTPSVTVVGTWKNKASKAADELTLQQLENKALLAQLTYNEALLAYQSDAVSLQNDIQDWKLRVARQKNLAEYHKQVLAQKQSLLEKGLGRQADVDDAAFDIDQDAYDMDMLLLEGLILENRVLMIQL